MKFKPDDFEITPLAAYGLLLIACVLGFLGLEGFARTEARLEQRVINAQTELSTLEAIRNTDHWASRFTQSSEARTALQSEIWQGKTVGVIAAEVQQALRGMSTTLEFDQLRVRVDPEPTTVDGITILTFEMTGRAQSSKDFADFFEAIAKYKKIIVIDEFDFAQSLRDRRAPRLTLSGRVPVNISPPSAAVGETP